MIPDIVWNGERNIRYGNQWLWLGIEEYRNQNTIAVRFEKKEADGAIWDTDFIMNFSEMKLAIQLDRSFTEDGKHYRLTYYGDNRYKTTISKSGSDCREGKNIAAEVLKSMM